MSDLSSSSAPFSEHAELARSAVSRWDWEAARKHANIALQSTTITHERAQALLLLGQACELQSCEREAQKYFEESWALYAQTDDVAGTAAALGHLSRTCAALLEADRSLTYAEEAFELRQDGLDSAAQSHLLYRIGIAYLALKQFDDAQRVLDASIWYGEVAEPGTSAALSAACALCLSEVQRIVFNEYAGAGRQPLDKLTEHLARANKRIEAEPQNGLASQKMALVLYDFCCAFITSRKQMVDETVAFVAKIWKSLENVPSNHWAHCFDSLGRLLLAVAQKDFEGAVQWARKAVQQARTGEHFAFEQFALGVQTAVEGYRDRASKAS